MTLISFELLLRNNDLVQMAPSLDTENVGGVVIG